MATGNVINIGDFPVVIPEGKVLRRAYLAVGEEKLPLFDAERTLVIQCQPMFDQSGYHYGTNVIWMEDKCGD